MHAILAREPFGPDRIGLRACIRAVKSLQIVSLVSTTRDELAPHYQTPCMHFARSYPAFCLQMLGQAQGLTANCGGTLEQDMHVRQNSR